MRLGQSRLLFGFIPIISIILASCSPQPTMTGVSAPTLSVKPGLTNTIVASTRLIQVTPTPSPEPVVSNFDKVRVSYHTVIMLERAADLLMAATAKVITGEFPVGDPALRIPYTNAFAVAIEYMNKTDPPPGIMNRGWKNVANVAVQFNIVYTALIQGKGISNQDYFNMKSFRQLMTNYENMAGQYLITSGVDADFLPYQHREMELHFKQAYGDQPMPELTEAGAK
jgi:hypothetical protein